MAETKKIFSIEYDVKGAVQGLEELHKVIAENKKEQEELRKAYKAGEISVSDYEKKTYELKTAQQEANKERKETTKLIGAEKGSLNELRGEVSRLTKERNGLSTSTKEGQTRIKEINAALDQHNKTIKENVDGLTQQKINIGNYGSALSGLPAPLSGAVNGIVGMTKAALAFIATPLGMVLGAITMAVMAVKSAFTSSEEGQNKYAKLTGIISSVLAKLKDILSGLGEALISVFENPQKALKDLGGLIKDQIQNRIEGLLELLPALGKAIKLAFSGNFKEAGKVAVDAVGKVGLGVEDVTGKIGNAINKTKEFGKETMKVAEQAGKVAEMRAKAEKIERDLIVKRAELEVRISELRLKAKQEQDFSDKERKAFLKEAVALEDSLLKKESEALTLKRDAITLENTFSRTNKEGKMAEALAIAEVSKKEAERHNKQRELQREINTLDKKMTDEQRKESEARIKIKDGEEKEKAKLHEQRIKEEAAIEAERIKQEEAAAADRIKRAEAAIDKLKELDWRRQADEAENLDVLKEIRLEKARDEYEAKLQFKDITQEEELLALTEYNILKEEIEFAHQSEMQRMKDDTKQQELAGFAAILSAANQNASSSVLIANDAFMKLASIDTSKIKSGKDAFAAIGEAAAGLTNFITHKHGEELASFDKYQQHVLSRSTATGEERAKLEKKLNNQRAKIMRRQAQEEKLKAMLDIGLATAVAVTKAMASQPMPPFLSAIAAGVLGGIQLAIAAAKPIPNFQTSGSFASGGSIEIGGKSHNQGGTHFYGTDGTHFEAEKGENLYVLKKDASAQINALSAFNQSFGGRSMSKKSAYLAEGGEVGGAPNVGELSRAITDAMQNVQIVTRVADIKTGMTDFDNINQAGVI